MSMIWERKGSLFVPAEPPPLSSVAIEPPTGCPHCGSEFVWGGEQCETCVGSHSPPGHDHDDNCRTRSFHCAQGHIVRGSVQRSCPTPGCDWKGKANCCGYGDGPKWTRWPDVNTSNHRNRA